MVTFADVRISRTPPILGGAPLHTPVVNSWRLARVTSPELGSSVRSDTKCPNRTSQTGLGERVFVTCPKVMAGTDAWRRSVASNGLTAVGGSGLTHHSWW